MERTHQQELTVVLWFVAAATLAASVVGNVFADSTAIVLRILLTAFAVGIPMLLLHAWGGWRLRDIFGETPNSIALVASAVCGVAIWVWVQWLIALIENEILTQQPRTLAIYDAENYADIWTGLVVHEVVLWPILSLFLMWGMLRWRLQGVSVLWFPLATGYIFGLLGMAVLGGGIGRFVGYGLAGLWAGYLSELTRTAWTGFAVQWVFLYANLWLLDNLERATGESSYTSMDWVVPLVIGLFAIVIATQVVRALQENKTEDAASGISVTPSMGLLTPIGLLLLNGAVILFIG